MQRIRWRWKDSNEHNSRAERLVDLIRFIHTHAGRFHRTSAQDSRCSALDRCCRGAHKQCTPIHQQQGDLHTWTCFSLYGWALRHPPLHISFACHSNALDAASTGCIYCLLLAHTSIAFILTHIRQPLSARRSQWDRTHSGQHPPLI